MRKLIRYLEQYELYFKFKYAPPVYALLKKKNPRLQRNYNAELRLYKTILHEIPTDGLIFDIGANIGSTVAIFEKIGRAIIAVEPDLINLNCLRARYAKKPSITIVPMAVSDVVSEETIYLLDNGSALHTLSNKWKNFLESPENDRWKQPVTFSKRSSIQATTLEALISKYGVPYFIKIDVEGYEEKVIKGLNTAIPIISFEANLPQFLKETIICIEHLDQLSEKTMFNYATNEKLLLPEFVERDEMIKIISSTQLRYLDVYCKM